MLSVKAILVIGLALTVADAASMHNQNQHQQRGLEKLLGEDLQNAENILSSSLAKLAEGDGPYFKLGTVVSAAYQQVSGSRYLYVAELISGQHMMVCKVDLFAQPWLKNGIRVTFYCPSGKYTGRHSV